MSQVVLEQTLSKVLVEEKELEEEHSNWKEPCNLDTSTALEQEAVGNREVGIGMDSKEVLDHTLEEVLEVLILLEE